MDLSDLRKDYQRGQLEREMMAENPFSQFEIWFDEAREAGVEEPNAMTLATADADGRPSSRVVLLKDFGPKGLVFYTSYESRKAREMEANPVASATFLWLRLERQVSVSGRTERVSRAESLKYFVTRPFANRLGAWISPQSKVITSRQILEAKFDEAKRKFASGEVPLPNAWGGYRIVPDRFEFWQGGAGRLHDRFLYRLTDAGSWSLERLAP